MTAISTSSQPSLPANVSSIESRIHKPSGKIGFIHACVYGRGGAGKTTLLGTMPGKGLVIDVPQIEGGTMVLADKTEHIDVLPVIRWEELEGAFQFLRVNPRKYDWVGIDTVTATHQLAKRRVIRDRPEGITSDAHKVSLPEHGQIGEMQADLFFKLNTLQMHVIFLGQERNRSDDNGSYLTIDVSPVALSALREPLDLIGRLYTQEVPDGTGKFVWERRMRVGAHEAFDTKTRAVPDRPMPMILRRPNLTEIFAYMRGGKKDGKPAAVPLSAEDEQEDSLLEIP